MATTDTRYPSLAPARITVALSGTSETTAAELTGLPARGALTVALGDLSSAAGTVVLSVYSDESKTMQLFRQTLDFTTVRWASVTFTQPVVFTSRPWYTVQADATSDGKTFGFQVQGVAIQ